MSPFPSTSHLSPRLPCRLLPFFRHGGGNPVLRFRRQTALLEPPPIRIFKHPRQIRSDPLTSKPQNYPARWDLLHVMPGRGGVEGVGGIWPTTIVYRGSVKIFGQKACLPPLGGRNARFSGIWWQNTENEATDAPRNAARGYGQLPTPQRQRR